MRRCDWIDIVCGKHKIAEMNLTTDCFIAQFAQILTLSLFVECHLASTGPDDPFGYQILAHADTKSPFYALELQRGIKNE